MPVKTFKGTLEIIFSDRQIKMNVIAPAGTKWFLDLDAGKNINLPYRKISAKVITAQFEGITYKVDLRRGKIDSYNTLFRLLPDHNQLLMDLGASSVY